MRHTRVVRIRSERHAHDIAVLRLHVQPVVHTVDRTILMYQVRVSAQYAQALCLSLSFVCVCCVCVVSNCDYVTRRTL